MRRPGGVARSIGFLFPRVLSAAIVLAVIGLAIFALLLFFGPFRQAMRKIDLCSDTSSGVYVFDPVERSRVCDG